MRFYRSIITFITLSLIAFTASKSFAEIVNFTLWADQPGSSSWWDAGFNLQGGWTSVNGVGYQSKTQNGSRNLIPYQEYTAYFDVNNNSSSEDLAYGVDFDPPTGYEVIVIDGGQEYINKIVKSWPAWGSGNSNNLTITLRKANPARQNVGAWLQAGSSGPYWLEARTLNLSLGWGHTDSYRTPPGFTQLAPDKEYVITIDCPYAFQDVNYTTYFSIPDGYDLYIDGEKRNDLQGTIGDEEQRQHTILLKAKASISGTYGALGRIDTSPARWSITLGTLINGQSAGSIEFVHDNPNLDLVEELLSSNIQSDVEVLKDQLVLRQIKTNQMLLDIVESNANSLTFNFYPHSAIGSQSGGFYTFSGQPVISYAFLRQSGGDDYTLTRTEGSRSQQYSFSSSASLDSLQFPSSLKTVEKNRQIIGAYESRDVTVKRSGSQTDYSINERHDFFDFGMKLASKTSTVGATQYTQTLSYNQSFTTATDKSSPDWGGYGRVSSAIALSGAATTFAYSSSTIGVGNMTQATSTLLDSQTSTKTFSYASDWNGNENLVSNISQSSPVTQDFDRSHNYTGEANTEPLNHISLSNFTGTDYEQSDVEYYRTHLWDTEYVDLPHSAKGPSGRKVSYLYQEGVYDSNTHEFSPVGWDPTSIRLRDEYMNLDADEIDYKYLDISQPGRIICYTIGDMDTRGELKYDGNVVDSDNHSGEGANFKIEYDTPQSGNHYIYVENRDSSSGQTRLIADLDLDTSDNVYSGDFWRETRFHGWSYMTTDPEAYAFTANGSGGSHLDDEEYLIDNMNNGYGFFDDSSGSKWLKVDLGSPRFVATITLKGGSVGQNHVGYWETNYCQIQKSDNGSSWITVHDFGSSPFNSGKTIAVNDTARYWRLYKSSSGDLGATEFRLSPNANFKDPAGMSTYQNKDVSGIYLVPEKSFKEVTIRDKAGYPVRTEMHIFTEYSNDEYNFDLVSWADITNDSTGNVTRIEKSTGEILEWEYTDGLMTAHVNATGIRAEYQHDALGRVTKVINKGAPTYGAYPPQLDIVTDYTYNALDQILSKTVTSGSLSQTWTSTFDTMGRISTETAPGNLTTTYTYSKDSSNRLVTNIVYPNGGNKQTVYYKDGSVKEVIGTAAINQYQTQSGDRITTTYGSSSSTRESVTTIDSLYRAKGLSGPANPNVQRAFDAFGRISTLYTEGQATIHYEYNTYGELFREGAFNADPTSDDPLKEYFNSFEKIGSDWWKVSETKAYPTVYDATSVTTSIVKNKLGGCSCGPVSETQVIDIHGNVTTTTITTDRTNRIRRKTVDSPASSIDAEEVWHNGRLVESTSTAGHVTEFVYDELGRQTEVIHPRKGSHKTFYDANGFVDYIEDPQGRQTDYTYDTGGRVSSVTNPDGKVTNYQYNGLNQVTQVSGDTHNTRNYQYDEHGTLYRITGITEIEWDYQDDTGLLNWKEIDNDRTTYTYDNDRRVSTVTSPRNITATYLYDSYGQVRETSYSDSTPTVTITRDRMRRVSSIVDDSGTRNYTYDAASLQLVDESIPYATDLLVSPTYATSGAVTGRGTGFSLGTSSNIDLYHQTGYDFDAYGRLDQVTGSINGSGNRAFDYGYLANSNLVDRIDQLSSGFARLHSYEPNRDLVASVDNMISSTTVAGFDYRYDSLGRRTDVVKTGTLYDIYGGSGLVEKYTYSSKNELLSANSYVGSDPDATLPALPGRAFSFNYNNRDYLSSKTSNGVTTTFGDDNYTFAKYISKSNYNAIDVSGADDAAATVTANGVSASRQDEYFYAAADISGQSSNLPYPQITVSSTLGGSTTSESFRVFEKGSSYVRNQDNDGNPTSDHRWTYVYDAENRLIEMTEKSYSANPDPRKRLHFDYDYLGRRWQKEVYEYVSSTWTLVSHTKYVYATNSFNLIAELDGLNNDAVIRTYTWGKDLSGTLSGAGGVGGLLMVSESGTDYLASYDGNGNLVALTNATDGSTAAAYEYSPYGRLLRAEGPMAQKNPFRFSTKYTDDETGLVYYGFRYYSPSLGRFINRDPIEEQGGLNLYAAFNNDPVNTIDVLGMAPIAATVELAPVEVKASETGTHYAADDNPFGFGSEEYYLWEDANYDMEEMLEYEYDEYEYGSYADEEEPQKEEPWSEEKCNEYASYLWDLAQGMANIAGQAQEIGNDNWDAVRRGAADGLEIANVIPETGIIPLDADTGATVGGLGALGLSVVGDRRFFISDPWGYPLDGSTVSSPGTARQLAEKTGRVAGTAAAAVGAATRFDVAREAVQRGDWDAALHYGVTGAVTGATAWIKNPWTNAGAGIGSFAEGFLWNIADQPVGDALTQLNDNYVQYRDAYETEYKKWEANCK